jgi:hypothetical protein
MVFQEYPKMIYPSGEISMTDWVLVNSKEEELAILAKVQPQETPAPEELQQQVRRRRRITKED